MLLEKGRVDTDNFYYGLDDVKLALKKVKYRDSDIIGMLRYIAYGDKSGLDPDYFGTDDDSIKEGIDEAFGEAYLNERAEEAMRFIKERRDDRKKEQARTGKIEVKEYTRKDGVVVKAHDRKKNKF